MTKTEYVIAILQPDNTITLCAEFKHKHIKDMTFNHAPRGIAHSRMTRKQFELYHQ